MFPLWLSLWLLAAAPSTPEPEGPPSTKIVINTDTHRLTLFEGDRVAATFPVAVGKPSTPTPHGQFAIKQKAKNWGNGFGTRWIGLTVPWGIYGVHGTNNPASIGRAVSHGCIRMHNRDVEALFTKVSKGTPVIIEGTPNRRLVFEGDAGSEVVEIQKRLSELGFYHGKADGFFTMELKRAVEAFQREKKLEPSGGVGRKTYEALGLLPLRSSAPRAA